MARYTGPDCKRCRREKTKLFLKGSKCESPKCPIEIRPYPPGEHGRARTKESEYLLQMREKQKAARIYGVLEKQFRGYYEEAHRRSGKTGENLLRILESRLDNVVYRAGFAQSRDAARQLVRHGHMLVNGVKVDIPSYRVSENDIVAVRADSSSSRRSSSPAPPPASAPCRPGSRSSPTGCGSSCTRCPRGRSSTPRAGAAHRRALLEVEPGSTSPSGRMPAGSIRRDVIWRTPAERGNTTC